MNEQALSQEPCDDVISRQAVLKIFEDRFFELQKAHRKDTQLGVNWCINTLKDMSPVNPQPCDDAISRDAINNLQKYRYNCGETSITCVSLKSINELPPVTQKPVECDDAISRESIKQKLQEHHDFFVNAYGGFKNMPQTDKARVDEITQCIAEVVNAPSVNPQPCEDAVSRASVIKFEGTNMACMGGDEIMKEFENNTQQPCDDAISREWLKTAIHNFYYGLKHTPTEEDIQAYIDVAPPVTQKSGKWIPLENRIEWGERVKCSECDQVFIVGDDISRHFCPNCGAKMESEE